MATISKILQTIQTKKIIWTPNHKI
jgi:hypothetical protein